MTLRIAFAGSPLVAVPYLRALVNAGVEVSVVVTREDSPQGRKRVLTPTPVAEVAEELGLPVVKANSLRDVTLPEFDLGVVVAYGGLVPERLLVAAPHGWINVHFSVLPAYRGAAPVQRALWDGQTSTGVSIFRLVREMDAGPVLFSRSIDFEPDETASDALDRIAHDTTDELVATIRLIDAGAITPVEQSGDATFAPKFAREDGRIDWALSASTIASRIRAVTSEPGAFTVQSGNPLGVLKARLGTPRAPNIGEVSTDGDGVFVGTGEGTIELLVVKPAGKSAMAAADWWRGQRDAVTFE